jgi:branched-chain amino acid transport system ATP-binding protein
MANVHTVFCRAAANRGTLGQGCYPLLTPLLELANVTRSFAGARVVDGVSLTVETGSITGLIGPNGAGKTTLFNLIAGALRPDSGHIALEGKRIEHEPAHRRLARGLGRTFQIPRPFPAMTVLENVLVAAPGQRGERVFANWIAPAAVAREERRNAEQAREIVEFVNLGALAGARAATLSGGQRKLLELARVLMASPRLILLDEPAAGVNPTLLGTIVARLRELNARGMTFLIVEHNMDLIARLCRPVHVMAAGRLLASGPAESVMGDPRVIDAYLGGVA